MKALSQQVSLLWTASLVLLVSVAAGCRPIDIDATYGKRRGSPGAESVNGTAVLASMFESAGHRVISWSRLSPKLNDVDTIVWFPDSFALPQAPQRKYLENWLQSKPGRTLVYVGRDYDAAIVYWKRIRPLAPATQAMELARRSAVAQALHDGRRSKLPNGESCDWFTVRSNLPKLQVASVQGPWSDGLDMAKLDIELDARLQVPAEKETEPWLSRDGGDSKARLTVERLLYSGDDQLITRINVSDWHGSKIIVVANGSLMLNLPLVNHENRKIAGRLVSSVPPGKVAFLESGEDGPPIREHEATANSPVGFEVFTVWPIGVILLHLAVLGILACITLFPIFGRPRELPPANRSDFGQHVSALGDMLELTGDREYAKSRLQHYHEQTKHEANTKRKPRR